MRGPSLSVIIPVFNGERFLAEAIASVLDQPVAEREVIVVDDGSDDDSRAVARLFGGAVTVIAQHNAGPAAARNMGLEMAKGRYIAFLDADDLWPPDRLSSQFELLENDHRLDVVLGETRCIDLGGVLTGPRFFMQLGCGLFRRTAFERVGVFDPDLRFSEDLDWFTRARECGLQIVVTDDVTLHHRLHDDNMTRGTDARELGYFHLLKRSLERRRVDGLGAAPELQPLNFRSTHRSDRR